MRSGRTGNTNPCTGLFDYCRAHTRWSKNCRILRSPHRLAQRVVKYCRSACLDSVEDRRRPWRRCRCCYPTITDAAWMLDPL